MKIVIATPHSRNDHIQEDLKEEAEIIRIKSPEELELEYLRNLNPNYIFFPHWSWIISREILNNFECIIFHMTDLPYGRGGSPLQNLIKLKHENTILSAVKCSEILDGGDIYLKKPLNLNGSAEEIFLRCNELMEQMIYDIVKKEPKAESQKGEIINFQRRKPIESDLKTCKNGDINEWYDQIRMLDAEGYPFAYIEINGLKLEFRRANKRANGLIADVYISEIDD